MLYGKCPIAKMSSENVYDRKFSKLWSGFQTLGNFLCLKLSSEKVPIDFFSKVSSSILTLGNFVLYKLSN